MASPAGTEFGQIFFRKNEMAMSVIRERAKTVPSAVRFSKKIALLGKISKKLYLPLVITESIIA
jgi:hypothetical protein